MQLPKNLPSDFKISSALSEQAVLMALFTPKRKVVFLEYALQDSDFLEKEPSIIDALIHTLSQEYLDEQIDFSLAYEAAALSDKAPSSVRALFPKDLTLIVGSEKILVTALLFGTASDYFQSRLRSKALNKSSTIELSTSEFYPAKILFTLIQEGPSELWHLSTEELKKVVSLAKEWSCYRVLDHLEEILGKRLLKETVFAIDLVESIQMAVEMGFEKVLEKLIVKWNDSEAGFILKNESVGLVAHFRNLHSVSTLSLFKTLAPYINGIGLHQELTSDPNVQELLNMVQKILWLDLSESRSPLAIELLPKGILHLILDRAEWLDDEWLIRSFQRYPNLETLSLREIYTLTFFSFSEMGKMTFISLDLSRMKNINDEELSLIQWGFSRLEHLSLFGIKTLSPGAIKEAIDSAPHLRRDV